MSTDLALFREPAWLQQPGEPDWLYEIFRIYLEIPKTWGGKRSKIKAWREWNERQGHSEKSNPPGKFWRLTRKWKWEERAQAWEDEQLKKVEESWVERQLAIRERSYEAGLQLYEKAIRALKSLGDEEISAGMIARFLELSFQLQNQAIPKAQLDEGHIAKILESIPPDRRARILSVIVAELD